MSDLGALQILVGEDELRLRLGKLSLGLLRRGLVGARIDDEQEIALLHVVSVAERDALHVAVHARTDLDGVDRLQAAGERVPSGHFLHHRRARRNGRSGGRRGRAGTASGDHQCDKAGRREPRQKACVIHGRNLRILERATGSGVLAGAGLSVFATGVRE